LIRDLDKTPNQLRGNQPQPFRFKETNGALTLQKRAAVRTVEISKPNQGEVKYERGFMGAIKTGVTP